MNEMQKELEVKRMVDEVKKKGNGVLTVKILSGQIVHIEKTESTHFQLERVDKK